MPNETPFLGALIDDRPEEAKQKDIHFVELFTSAAPVNWVEKAEPQWRKFPDQDQDGSGSCVAQTIKKLALINLWLKENIFVPFSATHIYQRRSNKPGGGMIGVEAFDLWMKGITLEQFAPSEKLTDVQMDAYKIEQYEEDIGKVFSVAGHVGGTPKDFEFIASTIQATGKGVMVWFYFTSDEWSPLIPVVKNPNLDLYAASTARHSVAAVDFFLFNGKKYLLIEDSAHFGGITRRLISEEFFKARNWFVRYPMNFKFQDQTVPPPSPTPVPPSIPGNLIHHFGQVLEFIPLDANGNISNMAKHNAQRTDVIALQDILRYEGVFPQNVQSTGYYGSTTSKAVYNYQVKHNVAPLSELNSIVPKGGRVGQKTLASLNSIYG